MIPVCKINNVYLYAMYFEIKIRSYKLLVGGTKYLNYTDKRDIITSQGTFLIITYMND